MAPRKKTQNTTTKKTQKSQKLEAFLSDFDDEVRTIVRRLKEKTNNLLKDADNLYKTALIKLPPAVRKTNWIEYSNLENPKPTVDVAMVQEEDAHVQQIIAQTHFPSTLSKSKEVKNLTNSDDENVSSLKSTVKKKKVSKKAPSTSKKARALSISKQGSTLQRSSRKPLITPARSVLDSSVIGATPLFTPRFDPRLPQTPALRLARHREKVYSMSVNGSPIAGNGQDIVITVPIGNGESIQLLSSELNSTDLTRLDERALRSIRNLQNRLTALCGTSK